MSGATTGRIRKLIGFQKHHHVPDTVSDATREFVKRAGFEDVKSLSEELYNDIKEAFGYKRREFDYSSEEGLAEIRTPDFDARVQIEQAEDNPKNYVLSTELTALHNEEIAQNPALHACFNGHCDMLSITFPKAIQVEDKIDVIEDIESLRGALSYAPDGTSFELKLPDLDLSIYVNTWTMRFQLLTLRNLAKLLDHSQKAFEILTDCGFDLRLSKKA